MRLSRLDRLLLLLDGFKYEEELDGVIIKRFSVIIDTHE